MLVGGLRPRSSMISEIDAGEFGELSLEAVSGPGGVHLGEHPGRVGKQNVMAFTDGAVSESRGDVAFTLRPCQQGLPGRISNSLSPQPQSLQ
jgi:hypothetical protein